MFSAGGIRLYGSLMGSSFWSFISCSPPRCIISDENIPFHFVRNWISCSCVSLIAQSSGLTPGGKVGCSSFSADIRFTYVLSFSLWIGPAVLNTFKSFSSQILDLFDSKNLCWPIKDSDGHPVIVSCILLWDDSGTNAEPTRSPFSVLATSTFLAFLRKPFHRLYDFIKFICRLCCKAMLHSFGCCTFPLHFLLHRSIAFFPKITGTFKLYWVVGTTLICSPGRDETSMKVSVHPKCGIVWPPAPSIFNSTGYMYDNGKSGL